MEKKSANGSLNAIDAAVIFLFPAKPFIEITLNPSLGKLKQNRYNMQLVLQVKKIGKDD